MKIELKNFKCWSNNTFEIPDKGIVLLSAESGTGKSSLLDAVSWVLFGNVKSTLSLGTTSGHVKLWYEDVYVYRSKRPNRLLVKYNNKEYEDDTAQFKIEEIFGSHFEIVSYIKQDNTNSFCRLSPSEKTEFIEQSIFQNTDIKHMKTRVKELTKERELNLVSLQSKLAVMEKFQIEKPVLTRFPIACDPSKYEETVTKYNKLFEQSDKKIYLLQEQLNNTKPIKTTKEFEAEINEKQKHIDYFTEQYTVKTSELNLISFDNDEYESLKYMKENIEKYREKCYIEKELESLSQTIKDNEEQTIKEKEKIKNQLSDIPENIEDELVAMEEYLQSSKQKEKLSEQLYELNDVSNEKLSVLKKEQEQHDLKNGVEVSCPGCNVDLVFMNSKLFHPKPNTVETKDKKKDIERCEKKLIKKKMIEKEYKELSEQYEEWHEQNDIEDNIKQLNEQIQMKKELKYRLKQIEKTSTSDRQLKKQKELQTSLDQYGGITITNSMNETDVVKQLTDIEMKKQIKRRLQDEIKTISDKNNRLINEVVNLRQRLSDAMEKEILISEYEEQMRDMNDKKSKYQKILYQIDKWRKSSDDMEKWEKYKRELSTTQSEIEIIKEKLESIYIIKTKITESESICTSNFINILNTHTQSYTDSFFKHNTILVNLQRQKISKKGSEKPQLNITVNYKGNETDMSILSGGEKDRIDLAFTLAMSEIFKSKVLLLDECISSLDHSNSENVIEGLRELYKGKLVIVVAHQVNEGLFDHVVKLN